MSRYLLLLSLFFVTGPVLAKSWSNAGPAIQTERVMGRLSINGQERVPLRQLVERRLAQKGENLRSYQLEGVTLYAKSWGGNAQATLRVGRESQTQNVRRARNFGFFLLNEPFTYHEITWDLRHGSGQSNEVWALIFQGQIEVRSVEVHLSRAQRSITIPMRDQIFAQDTNLDIKQELRRLGVRVGPNTQLNSLVLLAKSARGNGLAQLRIGRQVLSRENIPDARPGFSFQDTQQRSYNRIRWRNNGPTRGDWLLQMRGRVRVHSITVELD
jgi:hypothetical protein